MKILIVNTYDRGGAANACKRLHLGLLDTGINSKVLLKSKQNDWPESFQFVPEKNAPAFQEKLKRKLKMLARELKLYKKKNDLDFKVTFLNTRQKGLEMFSFPQSPLDITQSPLYKEADIINLHWVANFLDFESFFKNNSKPVVWTLHDMNPFSGGEHYEEVFLGIDNDGNPIERKKSEDEIRFSNQNLLLKKTILSQVDNLTIVAPSEWLVQEAQKSEVFRNFKIHYIPYGLDPTIYKPRNQRYSRDILNIPQEKKVVLFVADAVNKNRKGFVYLEKAFERLNNEDFVLCVVGSPSDEKKPRKNYLELGSINKEGLMSSAYSAADVFVIPSLMDNLPNTVLESLMCGTPVIGFPEGGIPDMIKSGENGLITEEISVSSLHKTLVEFFNSLESFKREEIRKEAVRNYDSKIQANRYISVFQNIMEKSNFVTNRKGRGNFKV